MDPISFFFFFQSIIGLRQGVTLFLHLFILAMEILSCTLSGAKKGGFLVGFSVGGRGVDVKVPYLLFTDDTFIIIYDACKEHMKQLNWVLMWFEAMVCLKINLEKSE